MLERMFGGEDLCNLLKGKAGRKWRLQQVIFYGAGDEAGGLDLERRARRRAAVTLPASLARVPPLFLFLFEHSQHHLEESASSSHTFLLDFLLN